MTESSPAHLLLVEDDPGHARLLEKNLRRAGMTHDLTIIPDGKEALDYLNRELGKAGSLQSTPLLILLDLNLPGYNGYQVLKCLKTNPRTKHLVVIMLTTTDDPSEIALCYSLGCNAFLTKPMAYEGLIELTHKLGAFLSIITLPVEQETVN